MELGISWVVGWHSVWKREGAIPNLRRVYTDRPTSRDGGKTSSPLPHQGLPEPLSREISAYTPGMNTTNTSHYTHPLRFATAIRFPQLAPRFAASGSVASSSAAYPILRRRAHCTLRAAGAGRVPAEATSVSGWPFLLIRESRNVPIELSDYGTGDYMVAR